MYPALHWQLLEEELPAIEDEAVGHATQAVATVAPTSTEYEPFEACRGSSRIIVLPGCARRACPAVWSRVPEVTKTSSDSLPCERVS